MDEAADDRRRARERSILAAAQAATAAGRGQAVFLAVNMNNMKAFNVVMGVAAGDKLLAGVEQGLRRLGPTWRTGGDEFVALVPGELAEARDRVRAFTWLYHARVSATDAWEIQFPDGRATQLVPWQHYEIVCNPRCGLAEIARDDGAEAERAERALELARRRCHQAAIDPGLHTAQGFAPIVRQPGSRAHKLAPGGCPVCKHDRPEVLNQDLGWSAERCPGCGLTYERFAKQYVLGEETEVNAG
jgi:GGDEF domain-containing protein